MVIDEGHFQLLGRGKDIGDDRPRSKGVNPRRGLVVPVTCRVSVIFGTGEYRVDAFDMTRQFLEIYSMKFGARLSKAVMCCNYVLN